MGDDYPDYGHNPDGDGSVGGCLGSLLGCPFLIVMVAIFLGVCIVGSMHLANVFPL